MNHKHRLSVACRIKALEAGTWQQSDGSFIWLRKMADMHLINALLKALAEADHIDIIQHLGAEVLRRGLREQAEQIAAERTSSC